MQGLTAPAVESVEIEDGAETQVAADNFIKRPIEFVTNIFSSVMRPIEDSDSIEAGSGTIPRSAASTPGRNFFSRWMKFLPLCRYMP